MAHLGKMTDLGYDAGTGARGIVLVHEWWGLNQGMKEIADEYARQGYRALAVDLYDGKVAEDRPTAGRYMESLDKTAALKKIDAAVNAISAGKVATVGWCMGGGLAFRAALSQPAKVAVAVNVYGETIDDPAALRAVKAKVLGIFAEKDQWITKQHAERFHRALEEAGVEHVVKIFEGKDHAFMNPTGKNYDREAAVAAWKILNDFLAKHLA